ncbi:MAG: hypothetical protein ACR2J6_03805 [Thermoleophilaceae bacterium]
MHPALDNAMSQWRDGEERLRSAELADQPYLESAVWQVLKEIRRRLGSSFEIGELAELYAGGTDWAEDIAQSRAGTETVAAVDAAFARYSREASDYAGGRMHFRA